MNSVYAFVAWVSTVISYIIFLIWAFTPENILHYYGFTYYPSRYYALALPSYIIVILFLGGIFYTGLNMFGTFNPTDMRTVEDNQTIHGSNEPVRYFDKTGYDPVPDIGDMDPSAVTDWLLYSRHPKSMTLPSSLHNNINNSNHNKSNISSSGKNDMIRVRSQRKSGLVNSLHNNDASNERSDSSYNSVNNNSTSNNNNSIGRNITSQSGSVQNRHPSPLILRAR